MKKYFWFWICFFVSEVICEVGFWPFWLMLLRAQPQDRSISLKFLYKTWIESESFGFLINFIVLLVLKLWLNINKMII